MAQKYTTNIQTNIPQIHIKYETNTSVSTRVSMGFENGAEQRSADPAKLKIVLKDCVPSM